MTLFDFLVAKQRDGFVARVPHQFGIKVIDLLPRALKRLQKDFAVESQHAGQVAAVVIGLSLQQNALEFVEVHCTLGGAGIHETN